MQKEKAIDKVRKLLALARSDNPNEAQAALLRAREIMAANKISEMDVRDSGSVKLNHVYFEKATFSNLKNTWLPTLATTIGDAHCCGTTECYKSGSKVRTIVYNGLGDDPYIACQILDYAVEHIQRFGKEDKRSIVSFLEDSLHQKIPKNLPAINMVNRANITSYARGFAEGLERKYQEQNVEHNEEMALVLVKPVEVTSYLEKLGESKVNFRKEAINTDIMQKGYKAGYEFDPTREINGREPAAMIAGLR